MKPDPKSAKKPEAAEPAPVPAARPAQRRVRFSNKTGQRIPMQVLDSLGKQHHVEIPSGGHVDWEALPALASYGPDVAVKMRAKLIGVKPAP